MQPATEQEALRSRHTPSFARILRELGISLLVSTYQAGRLVVLRPEGEAINTHFAWLPSPMGIAFDPQTSRLAIGARNDIWEFRNQPVLAPMFDRKPDAVFVVANRHYTGDIRIHEIAWQGDELWAVNTRFSCLCTFDPQYSFLPRWKPAFISALAPEDRCHLNGFCLVDGRIRSVSCLGLTDRKGGWRENKVSGGALLDFESGEVILRNLSMPHSPRHFAERDWILESGHGALCTADLAAGRVERIIELPGFTRGLDFFGSYAFIGLSQVRETATFSGLPITEQNHERVCGVWIVDLRTGAIAGFLRFEGHVQEIFAIQVLPAMGYPEIVNQTGPILDAAYFVPQITAEIDRKPWRDAAFTG